MIQLLDTHLPYILKAYCGGYLILNRGYKPLGFTPGQNCPYEQHPILYAIPAMDKKLACVLSHNSSPNMDTIALWDKWSHPLRSAKGMEAYFKRLATLANVRLEPMPWPEGARAGIDEANDSAYLHREVARAAREAKGF